MNLFQARERIQQRKGRRIELEDSIESLLQKIKKAKRRQRHVEQAHEILKQVGLETQQQLVYHISDVTSIALESVFEEPYKVILDFVERRGKTECDILFEKSGNKIDPMTASGGGVVDVTAFALRIASWSMKVPATRSIIVLDEPFKHLSKDLHARASEMIKLLSDKLGIQFIIITHEQALGHYADKVFEVKQRKGISSIKQS
jgi:ABC-type branched-subunit amino acid transport system ATPase component